jgi:hypothetical protein
LRSLIRPLADPSNEVEKGLSGDYRNIALDRKEVL